MKDPLLCIVFLGKGVTAPLFIIKLAMSLRETCPALKEGETTFSLEAPKVYVLKVFVLPDSVGIDNTRRHDPHPCVRGKNG